LESTVLSIESGVCHRGTASSQDSPVSRSWPRLDGALLLLRVACAAAFLYHGSAILLGAPDGPGPQNFSAFLHAPAIMGYLVGLAILTGVLFRAGAACIINLVVGAIFLVHISHGFDVGKGGFECAFAQPLIDFSLLLTGSGAYSLAGILPPPLPKL